MYTNKMCVMRCRHITLFVEWRRLLTQQDQFDFCRRHGLANIRVKSFMSSTTHLLSRVRESLTPAAANLLVFDYIGVPNVYKQNLLRLILAWNGKAYTRRMLVYTSHICFGVNTLFSIISYTHVLTYLYLSISVYIACAGEDNILEAKALQNKSPTSFYTAAIESVGLSANHIKPLFPKEIPWQLQGSVKKSYDARFSDTTRTPLQLITAMISASASPIIWLTHEIKIRDVSPLPFSSIYMLLSMT